MNQRSINQRSFMLLLVTFFLLLVNGSIQADNESVDNLPPINVLTSVQTSQSVVALTIDDGWNEPALIQMLDLLSAHNAHATFFLTGFAIKNYIAPETMMRLFNEGNELAYHTVRHNAPSRPAADFNNKVPDATYWRKDVDWWFNIVDTKLIDAGLERDKIDALKASIKYARAPEGDFSKAFMTGVTARNLQPVFWSRLDDSLPGADHAGDIILLHVKDADVSVLQMYLDDPSYSEINLSELLAKVTENMIQGAAPKYTAVKNKIQMPIQIAPLPLPKLKEKAKR